MTFVEAIPHVKDELRKSRLEALPTFCNSNEGMLKAAAPDIFLSQRMLEVTL